MMRYALAVGSVWSVLLCTFAAVDVADAQAVRTQWYALTQRTTQDSFRLISPDNDVVAFPININNYWGLMNASGDLIAPPWFDWTDYAYESSIARAIVDGRTGYINLAGKWVIPPDFVWADRFADGFAVFQDAGSRKYGFIDRRGEAVHPPTLDGVLRFEDGLAAASVGGKVGYLDKRMRWFVEPTFVVGRSFRDGVAMVRHVGEVDAQPGPWASIDKRGKVTWEDTAGVISELGSFGDGYVRFRTQGDAGRWGYLDKRMKRVIEPTFVDARDFHEGLASAAVVDPATGVVRWGLISKNGKWAVEPTFDEADDFVGSQILVKRDGLYGFVDRVASRGIEPAFEFAEPFFEGFARVAAEDGFTYIGRTGRNAIAPKIHPAGIDIQTLSARVFRQDPHLLHRPEYYRVPDFRPQPSIPYEPEHFYDDRLPRR